MTQEEKDLYNKLKKEVSKANGRLASLQRYTGRDVSWSGKKLQQVLDNEKIGAWTPSSRIYLRKDMDIEQLKRIDKAVNQFLNSKVSKIPGIKNQIKASKKGFQKTFEVSEEEAEAMYEAFEDDLLGWIFKYIEPSTFWALIQEAKENNYSEEKFINMIKDYIDFGNDLDIKEKLLQIYERYVLS